MNESSMASSGNGEHDPCKPLRNLDTHLRKSRARILNLLEVHSLCAIRDLRYILFATICDDLYDAAKAFHGDENPGEFRFYVWPGYDSTELGENQKTRVQLETCVCKKEASGEMTACGISPLYATSTLTEQINEQYSDKHGSHVSEEKLNKAIGEVYKTRDKKLGLKKGVWRPAGLVSESMVEPDVPDDQKPPSGLKDHLWGGKTTQKGYRLLLTPASLLFSHILQKRLLDDLTPGSTHQWVVDNADKIKGLIVSCDDEAKSEPLENKKERNKDYCKVNLSESPLSAAGPNMEKQIAATNGKFYLSAWPAINGKSTNASPEERSLQVRIYSPWLTSVFAPTCIFQDKTSNSKFPLLQWEDFWKNTELEPPRYFKEKFNEVSCEINELEPKLMRPLVLRCGQYKYWISLALDSVPKVKGSTSSNLGTLMIYSEIGLNELFLNSIRNWIQEIYFLFRQHENIQRAEKIGSEQNASDVNQAISHELKNIVPLIGYAPEWLSSHLRDYLLGFALPGITKLDQDSDKGRLPKLLFGEDDQSYLEWIMGLCLLAAQIESTVVPGKSAHIPPTPDAWQSNAKILSACFHVDIEASEGNLPVLFNERCVLGTAILCVLRNCLQHTTEYLPHESVNGFSYGVFRRKASSGLTVCRLTDFNDPNWEGKDFKVTNSFWGSVAGKKGGSRAAVNYYLGQIAAFKRRAVYQLQMGPGVIDEYSATLPSLLHTQK